MNENPLISVIVPAYNASKYINDCVKSVLNQDYQNFELIVVNDGSKDNTLELLNKLADTDERIIVIDKKNGGVSTARNAGLEKARGEYIAFLDSDDTFLENSLSSFISEINDNVDFVICSTREIRLSTQDIVFNRKTFKNKEQINEDFIDFDKYIRKPCANLYRKSIIDKYSIRFPLNISFGEDHIFNLEYLKHAEKAVVISDKIVYNYMILHNGLCLRYHEDMNMLEKIIYLKIADFFGGINQIPEKYHNYYVECYLNGCIEYYISQVHFKKASSKIEETFDIYSDLINKNIMDKLFNKNQQNLINSKRYRQFVLSFMITHPKKTIYRKLKKVMKNIIKNKK